MVLERELETGLPYFRLMGKEDVKDPKKLAPFWSSKPEDQDDEVKKRIGSDGILYLQSSIPIPEGLGNRCGDCGGVVAESRDIVSKKGRMARVLISRNCLGHCREQRISAKVIKVSERMILKCLLSVKFT